MLANLLAIIIGLGSLGFYLTAFILPEVHRRSDFFWSGIGMFYAVVLWYCAQQIHGAVLLWQTASVGLLLWLGYQTLLLRRETTPAAQQTPVRLSKSDRDRTAAIRPIARDYEFVEDGVDDILEQEPDPDSPILLKPEPDEFALKIVVPAAMPKPSVEPGVEDEVPENIPTPDTSPAPTQTREKPNPLAAVGIVAGWLKEMLTPQKKAPKPMIELPLRPPSIPKPDKSSDTDAVANSAGQPADGETSEVSAKKSEITADSVTPSPIPPVKKDISSVPDPSANLEPVVATPAPAPPPSVSTAMPQPESDEESNWPDDEFWD